ncbi:MAG: L-ribulose-5-phosphate 4-epimerase [Verrucomicrobiota bacterium]|nr:L-ribulose-5-phosphate 4-epimerase [Limisphaera sp.]MDW8381104.1 L-ribulose-5-phosphate 4-epimerase [Verrucomicrobiota bacterium]
MKLTELKQAVWEANLRLVREGLVIETWGNASAVDRQQGWVVIKPSGVPYDQMKPEHMVVVRLDTGEPLQSRLRPSSDTPTHLVLYRSFPEIGGVVHTHSLYATAWAQACRPIPCYGTTQADYWFGEVPCTRAMKPSEIQQDYEANTGHVIVETFQGVNPMEHPAVLVAGHGPFTWGRDVHEAVHNAVVLEFVARLASETERLAPRARPIARPLLEKHFLRKHGPNAYYGQKEGHGPARSGSPRS